MKLTALERKAEEKLGVTVKKYEIGFYNPLSELSASVEVKSWNGPEHAERKARSFHGFHEKWEITYIHEKR